MNPQLLETVVLQLLVNHPEAKRLIQAIGDHHLQAENAADAPNELHDLALQLQAHRPLPQLHARKKP